MGLPTLSISMGDPLGIGPEILAKALADPATRALARFRVHAHGPTLAHTIAHLGLDLTLNRDGLELIHRDTPGSTPPLPPLPPLPPRGPAVPSATGGALSFACVEAAIADAQRPPNDPARADAIVTAPIAKESWHLAGLRYPGHTELLAERFASPRSAMLFVGPSLRVILATIHVPLAKVPGLLTSARVLECIELADEACRALGVPRPRIAVAGLNPHAGESRLFGDEDADVIAPAVDAARAKGLSAAGPLPGDTVFLAAIKGHADAVVAMYHDQGLIPVKLLDRERSINVTTGLSWQGRPVIRTSPAHGTAFDIAGTNHADPRSMIEAIALAARMVAARA
jgi:4-hydroxythreonine-4-phosphate dehydrogenase